MIEVEKPPYPLANNLALVDEEAVRDYLDMLFSRVFWKPHHFVCIRGIGEKGTWQEGKFRSDEWVQPGLDEFPDEELAGTAMRHARTWAQWHVAAFIVPAVLKEARGTSQAVDLFTALVVDLDSGDTNAKAAWLDTNIGTPSMVVASGGTTELGTPKLHVYYVLDEPEGDIAAVVEARHQLALKAGGDLQFGRGTPDNPLGRAHQPIRIPGTVHAKNGNAQASRLLFASGPLYDFAVLSETIRRAPGGPWMVEDRTVAALPESGFLFGPTLNHHADMEALLLETIHEGGDGNDTRWTRFNAVAGHYIHCARKGDFGLEEAEHRAYGWMLAQMVPPWPDARFKREWHALVERDRRAKGPIDTRPPTPPTVEELKAEPERVSAERRLMTWAVHRWTQGEPPPRRFLVKGLLMTGARHMLVAEGGAGKTFAALDLCVKIATFDPEAPQESWMGQPVVDGGTVVMITTEDDRDELWRRLHALDPEGRRFRAGNRLIVLPTINAGGGFTLGKIGRNGEIEPTTEWAEILAQLDLIPDLKLVVIDTLNSTLHGDENAAVVINQYVKMTDSICKRGGAVLLTHHIRKQNNQAGGKIRPIITAEDMFNEIRGSSAMSAAFRVNLGLWHCHDYAKRMKAMGLEPKAKHLWKFGVLKVNNNEMMDGVRYMLRNDRGLLDDVTDQATSALAGVEAQQRAWLVAGIAAAAAAGRPYKMAKKDSPDGLARRRHELHELLRGRDFGPEKIDRMLEDLIAEKEVVVREVAWRRIDGKPISAQVLDVPGGRYSGKDPEDVMPDAEYTPPEWDRLYRYNPAEGTIVPADSPRMEFG